MLGDVIQDLPDFACECTRTKRFLQELGFSIENAVPEECVVGIA